MPTGYLVSLGDGSLDSGDVLNTSTVSFTTSSTIGSGSINFDGRIFRSNVTDYTLNGTYYEATDGNVYFVPNSMPRRMDSGEVNSAPSYSNADGVVEGTGGDDVLDSSYVDTDGDQIDSGTGTGPSGMGDSVSAGDGNDTIDAGAGNDTISGGGGSDSIQGGSGDDVISGDGITAASATSESLNWDSAGADEQNISGGITQTTGVMDVTVDFTNDGNATGFSVESTTTNYVGAGEPFDPNSSLSLTGSGAGDTSTTTISFETNDPDSYSDNVENVTFRLNDIDGYSGSWQDIITITAVDANGNTVTLSFSSNGDDTTSGNTITAGLSADSYSDASGSIMVTIPGPLQSITIDYNNGYTGGQALAISDIHFDTIPVQPGDDTIDGGTGNDLIDGEDGADSLIGGDGTDTLIGGAGDDTLAGGADGDSISGGAGMDFLDYSDSDAGVDVDLGANTATGGHATGDTLAGGLDGIIGSDWDDTLVGYDGQGADWTNVFYGGGGDDYLDGAGGDDSLYGGDGSDTIIGGAGADLLDGGAGEDELYVGGGDTAVGGEGDDTFIISGGGGTISIDGGEGSEGGGDTLDFGGQIDWGSITYTSTDPGNLAGSVTLDDGTVVTFDNIESVVICFKKGTKIDTPRGQRAVETLKPGDLVITRDNGVQPVRWAGRRRVEGKGDFAPIRFAPGTVGNTRPLIVSPQHRMLHRSSAATLLFDTPEVLVAARHLVNGHSIRQVEKDQIDYVHILFDRHEIIFAEGAPSESFHPGRHGLNGVMGAAREELFALFPDLRCDPDSFGDTARPCLREFEARLLQPA
ncbi:Hint domain-containing protein [Thalassovita sp.]|uniref:Hint domain-containing protein n=1 Tax=Thalassovita sp. TaxID=1979401 RepID=UPI002881325A|nr:Hint domain-containing protein [Thalassovita sp.]MDF1802768.1 Hint domain-containing protein [Thalassovita sp.]